MDFLFSSFVQALALIFALDPEVLITAWTSIWTSLTAITLAALIAGPIGLAVGAGRFPGRRAVLILLNTLMALPTVMVGLILYGFLSRQGPLGPLGLLFTPWALIMGQTVLALPIVAHYVATAVSGADPRIVPTLQTLGAGRLETALQLAREVRFGIMAAVVAGFGRIIAEVGAAMMLGGNIRHSTRTLTTSIALETSKGDFAFALALGIILMIVALTVNLFLNALQYRKHGGKLQVIGETR